MLSNTELENIFINKELNQSERITYHWLKQKFNYKFGEIKKQRDSPDFICKDKKGYEVKTLYGNTLVFTNVQFKTLSKKDMIVVVDCTKEKVVDFFLWGKKDKVNWKCVLSNSFKGYTSFRMEKETLTTLKRIKPLIELEEKCSFDSWCDVINYLISYRNKKPFNIEPFKL